jgi:hypothetical protein
MHAVHNQRAKVNSCIAKRKTFQRAIFGKPNQKWDKGIKVQSDASTVLSMTKE